MSGSVSCCYDRLVMLYLKDILHYLHQEAVLPAELIVNATIDVQLLLTAVSHTSSVGCFSIDA